MNSCPILQLYGYRFMRQLHQKSAGKGYKHTSNSASKDAKCKPIWPKQDRSRQKKGFLFADKVRGSPYEFHLCGWAKIPKIGRQACTLHLAWKWRWDYEVSVRVTLVTSKSCKMATYGKQESVVTESAFPLDSVQDMEDVALQELLLHTLWEQLL